jgi:hypothetical protein
MSYLRKFVEYQETRGIRIADEIRAAGDNIRVGGGGITSPDTIRGKTSTNHLVLVHTLNSIWPPTARAPTYRWPGDA